VGRAWLAAGADVHKARVDARSDPSSDVAMLIW